MELKGLQSVEETNTGRLGPCGSQRVPAGTVKWTIGRETLITFPSLLHKN